MEPRIRSTIDELSLDEKLRLIQGAVDPERQSTGYVPGIERLGVPALRLVDGPLGVRAVGEFSTAFPASMALAASWDRTLAREFGRGLGRETAALDQDVVLAPGVNIVRVPTGGRNFEYLSEDPVLASEIGVDAIAGIQSEGVGATVKHFVANNQEENRYEVDVSVSERALREIYLPAFRAAVAEADVAAVMTAYNRVNGSHMSQHERLLRDVLKGEWGFDGLVMSDWWGTSNAVAAANGGLDLEMPGVAPEDLLPEDAEALDRDGDAERLLPEASTHFGGPLREALADGRVRESTLDEKVERVLRTVETFGSGENPDRDGELDSERHRELARRIAVEGTVLLKNDGALPLTDVGTVAVVGPNADEAKCGGGGSSEVNPVVSTAPLDGIRGRNVDVSFERGVPPVAETSLFGDGDGGDSNGGDGADADLDDAVAAAADADCAVVVVRDDASEFVDRDGMALPGDQDRLVSAVADAADRTVVVLRTSGPVEMPWLDDVDAVLETWYPGQADGDALSDVLFGDADPGGRLPVTFGESSEDYPTSTEETYPGVDGAVRYDEGIFVGYRYFDAEGTDPLFPFGHGLSYASFEYGQPTVAAETDGVTVSVPVRNTGDRPGKDVVQVYAEKSAVDPPTPERELVGFSPVRLDPGVEETVTVSVDHDAFAYYDDEDGWTIPRGTHVLHVGRSSRDIRFSVTVTV